MDVVNELWKRLINDLVRSAWLRDEKKTSEAVAEINKFTANFELHKTK